MIVRHISSTRSRRKVSSMILSRMNQNQNQCHPYSRPRSILLSTAAIQDMHDENPVRLDCNKTCWQAEHNMDIQRVTQKAIIHELTQQQTKTIEDTVPWFLNNMPSSYFRSVPEQSRMDHIKALSAIKDANLDLHLNLKSHLPDGQLVLTYIRPGKDAGRLLNLVKDLPWNFDSEEYLPLSRVQVFTSNDETMSLSMFVYDGDSPPSSSSSSSFDVKKVGGKILDYAKKLQNGEFNHETSTSGTIPDPSPIFEEEQLMKYLRKCDESYVIRSSPLRFLKQREQYELVTGTECMAVSIEKADMDGSNHHNYSVDIAVANSLPQIALENAARVLYQHNFEVVRSHLDMISDDENGSVCMMRLLVSPLNHGHLQETMSESAKNKIIHELKRTKWLDPKTMELVFKQHPWIGLPQGEIVTAFCALLHPIMTKRNPYAYSLANIQSLITSQRYIKHAALIAELFMAKFDSQETLSKESFDARSQAIANDISNDVEDTIAKELLLKMIDIVSCTLRTNVFVENRYSLGLRLDPKLMGEEANAKEMPFGIIFSHGRRFNAFHVRFRDIARGGMRLVTPTNQEQHALESARQYEECYNLAYSQQLKNKDIPEGGSKAVNLINCFGLSEEAKQFVMRKSVKAFTNTLLDLVVEYNEDDNQVDYLGKKEVIYLGPDEQVTVDDIDWIVKRAAIRGYDTPNAFMSSKPLTGINHKEYGVTSEGVNTYLDVALREVLKINPDKDSFTVKMTGGPDGDVAGNEIKILIREYGANVNIVGISDASGCAEDPRGLDHEELLRLVHEGLCISNFDSSKLSSDGVVYLSDNEEGMNKRNTMHNRLVADAFIPAGGRPSTIDMTNYNKYLLEDGTPSARLIVEGANLFISNQARQALYDEAGVMIVKDSSANKCGVITSSYEICASMLLDENEFFENKQAIVEEVVQKLKDLAKLEAELLFKEYEDVKVSLPEVSKRISNSINSSTDVLIAALVQMSEVEREELFPLFRDHLPKTIADLAFERVRDAVPKQYVINAIASHIASKMVYKEGCGYIDSLPQEKLMDIAFKYIAKEKEVMSLTELLAESNIPEEERELMLEILERSGVRTALAIDNKN